MGFLSSILGAQNNTVATGPSNQQIVDAQGNVTSGLGQQRNFIDSAAAQNGFGNQANVFNQMQGLANQLQLQSQGQGPNPALAQLNQTTAQNIASQASLAAGQRGSSANAGLIARQAGQQGGQLNQQAASQAAIMRAQQQLAAQQQLQQQQGMLAGVANQQIATQGNAIQNYGQQALQGQQQLFGQQSSANQINAGVAGQNAKTNADIAGGVLGGVGSATGLFAEGGEIKIPSVEHYRTEPQHTGGVYADGGRVNHALAFLRGEPIAMAHGGEVPAKVSPGEIVLSRSEASSPKKAAQVAALKEKYDKKVPGKAKVKGNSYKNDTVDMKLDEGGIVIPRSHSSDPDKAAQFAYAVAMKNRKGSK